MSKNYLFEKVFLVIIALLASIFSTQIIPDHFFNRFRINEIGKDKVDGVAFFYDFNHDGNSERVKLSSSSTSQTLSIETQKKFLSFVLDEIFFVLPEKERFIPTKVYFDDYNHDNKDELFFFTINDSILFLYVLDVDVEKYKIDIKLRLPITEYRHFSGNPDIVLKSVKFGDIDNDGNDEILFATTAGYTIQPRNIYSVNIDKKIITKTPRTSIEYDGFIITDLNKDGRKELIVNNQATGNTLPKAEMDSMPVPTDPDSLRIYKYYKSISYELGDFSAYIITLDNDLNFLYPPVEFRGWSKIVNSIPFINGKVLSVVTSKRDTSWIPKLILSDLKGNIIKSVELENYRYTPFLFPFYDTLDYTIEVFPNNNAKPICIFDTNLNLLETKRFPKGLYYTSNIIDLNDDGDFERVFYSSIDKSLMVSDYFFNDYINIPVNESNVKMIDFDKIYFNGAPFLHVRINDTNYYFKFKLNPLSIFRYPAYILIFLGWILILQYLVKFNNKRLAREKEKLEKLVAQRTSEIAQKNNELMNLNEKLKEQKDQIQSQNEELQQMLEELLTQRDHIEEQKNKIEKIHNELSKSLDYAKKLQTSILPDLSMLKIYFNDYFILYKPKEKVSGDFYWVTHVNDEIIIAVTDCTGHGVPGAFLSMLGITFLNEIVKSEKITSPKEILERMRELVINIFKQKGQRGEQKDGMDIAILNINTKTNQCTYAGANNYVYLVTSGIPMFDNLNKAKQFDWTSNPLTRKVLYELKPDKMPISYYAEMKDFTDVKFRLRKGDVIYLFTDGYSDQFGGEDNKKFKLTSFKKLLLQISDLPAGEQKETLDKTFDRWKGINEQIDDVTVLGLFV